MKKTSLRLFVLLLAALMILPLLASCKPGEGGDSTTDAGDAEVVVDLAGYRVIRPADAPQDVVETAVALRRALVEVFGDGVEIKDDWLKEGVTAEIEEMKEILVGGTNRSASAAALADVTDSTSFVITVIGNKVVINGGTGSAVTAGVNYFVETLLAAAPDGKLRLPENYRYVSEPLPALELASTAASKFTIVYKDGLDNTKNANDEKDKYDLEVDLARSVRTRMASVTGLDESRIKLATDWVKPGTDTSDFLEILIGEADRPEYWEFVNSLGYDEYGYAVINNKVVVAGRNLTTTDLAVQVFNAYLGSAATGEKGDRRIIAMGGTRYVKKYNGGWFTDFPAYDGGKIAGTQDLGYKNLQVFISDTNETEFLAYRAKLEKEGYKLAAENEIAGNLFATYTGDKGEIHTYYIPYEKMTHIVTAPKGQYQLPAHFTKESVPAYTKITESKITQMNLNYAAGNFGMCYIITLEDGSFIIYDGGGYNASYGDDTRLYELLKEINVRPDGKIVIAAWFLSHEHWDHFTNFQNFISRYGSKVELEYCFLNTPCKSEVYNSNNPNYYVESKLPGFKTAIGSPTVVKVHTGMKFYIRNAEVEVLFTQEDLYPHRCDFFNESSMITRMTVAGQTVLWFGDTRNYGSAALCNRYPQYVKSDICQVAHHGYDGATLKVYSLIKPDTLLWPTSIANQKSQTSGRADSYYGVDNSIAHNLGVQSIIIAEPTQTITLPYKPGDTIVTNQH